MTGVTVRFGAATALDDVSLTIRPGQRVALAGASGAGKSTLLNVINGSVSPTAGSVELFGIDPAAAHRRAVRAVRARIGTVYQHLELVGQLRVVHNVNAGHLASWSAARALWSLLVPQQRAEASAALERVGLAERIFERTERLSGGQRQRVAIARLLIQQPELVLADEPASALDPRWADVVLRLLGELAEHHGGAMIVSLHDPRLALQHCDRVIGLDAGRITLDESAAALRPEDLGELYRAQP